MILKKLIERSLNVQIKDVQAIGDLDPDTCGKVIETMDNSTNHLAVKLDVSKKSSIEESMKSIQDKFSRYSFSKL